MEDIRELVLKRIEEKEIRKSEAYSRIKNIMRSPLAIVLNWVMNIAGK